MTSHRIWSTLVLIAALTTGCASTVSNVSGTAPVGADLGDRTFAQKLRDQGIENAAQINIYKLNSRFKDQSRIKFTAFHDAVLITGQVPDPNLKTIAGDSVRAIREVSVVHNELAVGPQSDYSTIVQDGILSARVRTAIIQSSVKSSRVKYVVERGVVYLMGILYPAETQDLIASVQQIPGIVKIVSLVDVIKTGSLAVPPSTANTLNTRPQVYVPQQPASVAPLYQAPALEVQPAASVQGAAQGSAQAINPYEQIDQQMNQESNTTQQVLTQPILVQPTQLSPE